MLKHGRYAFAMFCMLYLTQALAWNALGHKLIAEIAYQHLTPHARQAFNHYNHALDKIYPSRTFVNAATWLDELRFRDVGWFTSIHYSDLPFSLDHSSLPPVPAINAVWGIEEATRVILSAKACNFDKGISLRVLIHVIGDIHQPMHAVTRVSKKYPEGDRAGNLVKLGKNPVAGNLHAYWDKGGGVLSAKATYSQAEISAMASGIEKHWPCRLSRIKPEPGNWAKESHDLAVEKAYQLHNGEIPDEAYQRAVQKITEKRLALAGCRLSALLNYLDTELTSKKRKRLSYELISKHKKRNIH